MRRTRAAPRRPQPGVGGGFGLSPRDVSAQTSNWRSEDGVIRSRILGTGRAVPSCVRTNADIERMVDTSDAWITERTGIKERRILEPGRAASDLAAEAARAACAAAG